MSGPSGSGKTSLMRRIMSNEVVSFTTRAPRPGEVEGVDYTYIDKNTFEELLKNDGLAEFATYGDESYGITAEEFSNKIARGNAFAIVNIDGKEQLERLWENTVSIFVYTSGEEAKGRMVNRGDADASVAKRLSTFTDELNNMSFYDYVVENPNGDFEKTIETIKEILRAEGVIL
ncbi:guanylate kinase [Paenibacillus xylanexedens]|uniref:guanylate kinase n=1 Tax=Paenibacillus xylanexedens TaxID=528191 RepID=UPI0023E8DAA3|nr:hypothetical protein [Paenibacillus xylanexedens]